METIEKKPEMCTTAVVTETGAMVGIVKRGELGYYKTDWNFPDYASADKYSKEYNAVLGVSEEEAVKMVLTSMRKQDN